MGFATVTRLDGPRTAARIVAPVCAAGSLALLFRAVSRNPSWLLIGFFVFWRAEVTYGRG